MTSFSVGKMGSLPCVAVARVEMCRRVVESCYGSVQCPCVIIWPEMFARQVTARARPDASYKYTALYSLRGSAFFRSLQPLQASGHSNFALC